MPASALAEGAVARVKQEEAELFGLFREAAANVLAGAKALQEMFDQYGDPRSQWAGIEAWERPGGGGGGPPHGWSSTASPGRRLWPVNWSTLSWLLRDRSSRRSIVCPALPMWKRAVSRSTVWRMRPVKFTVERSHRSSRAIAPWPFGP